MTKNIAVIPARGGSKRLPNKNIMPLGGMPLIAHSIHYAQANPLIVDAVYVSTDDTRIKSIAQEFGANVINRPDELSTDEQPTITALQHVLEQLSADVEHVILLQPTCPLRPKSLLEEAYARYIEGDFDSLMTVTKVMEKFGKIKNDRFIPFNYTFGQRSQDLEPLYRENGLLYITRAKSIGQGAILAENNVAFPVDSPFAEIDIDTEADFKYAQYLLNTKT